MKITLLIINLINIFCLFIVTIKYFRKEYMNKLESFFDLFIILKSVIAFIFFNYILLTYGIEGDRLLFLIIPTSIYSYLTYNLLKDIK